MLEHEATAAMDSEKTPIRVVNVLADEHIELRDSTGNTRLQADLSADSIAFQVAGCKVHLRASSGKLEISCSSAIRFVTPETIEFVAGQGVRMAAGNACCRLNPAGLKVSGDELSIGVDSVSLTGVELKARMERICLTAGKLEQFAERIFRHARYAYERLECLLDIRAGRIRSEAAGCHTIRSQDVRIVAEEEARIQANTINLG